MREKRNSISIPLDVCAYGGIEAKNILKERKQQGF